MNYRTITIFNARTRKLIKFVAQAHLRAFQTFFYSNLTDLKISHDHEESVRIKSYYIKNFCHDQNYIIQIRTQSDAKMYKGVKELEQRTFLC